MEGEGVIMREQLTKSDVQKIEEEIEYRKLVVRKDALEAVKEARAHGDLSENFEYHAAKKDKNQNESRIRYLERMLKTAEVIDDSSADNEVGINNTVTLYCEGDPRIIPREAPMENKGVTSPPWKPIASVKIVKSNFKIQSYP